MIAFVTLRRLIGLVALAPVLLALGCGSAAQEEMGSGSAPTEWPAMQELEGENGLMAVGYAGERGDWGAAAEQAASDQFVAVVDKFEQSQLPSAYSDRTSEKEAAVKALRDLISAAQSGDQAAVEEAWKSVSEKMAALKQEE